ncbi:YqgE/AlgH family protein [Rickettsia endosymbiont of Cardiosporidium cionae]|uniref:YqgE/AlgH family protein n=1 Tax=Rickettsia endosymbiont of Cardiosporidium cionae TaxID=2777155 RepID=UPI001894FC6B|nr:YqgE/AlgH family protein [Rickettsia endosymbiont of Cardiosporidium cionae]KAF8818602.1 YqgE/AlgH family protein [Rickettsia endosymbiont of Cardiosporidium cionae]
MNILKISNLNNKLLIASPSIHQGKLFHKSLIYITHHGDDGAFGLIINQPLNQLLNQIEDHLIISELKLEVYLGGPISTEKKFFLHSNEYNKNLLFDKSDNYLNVSTNSQILQDISSGTGPKNTMIMVGYSSWQPGQLEFEIENGLWLLSEVDVDLVFLTNNQDKWEIALNSLLGDAKCYIPNIGSC